MPPLWQAGKPTRVLCFHFVNWYSMPSVLVMLHQSEYLIIQNIPFLDSGSYSIKNINLRLFGEIPVITFISIAWFWINCINQWILLVMFLFTKQKHSK